MTAAVIDPEFVQKLASPAPPTGVSDYDAGYNAGWDDGYNGGWEDAYCEGYQDGQAGETGAIADDLGAWWPCKWCGKRADCYAVRDELWRTYGPPTGGWLCIDCFEQRLGRALTRDDLIDCGCDTGRADNVIARRAV